MPRAGQDRRRVPASLPRPGGLRPRPGRSIGCWAGPGISVETLRHLLLDQVLPRLLAQRGQLVLHAGAVRAGSRAIAFVGETGSGKSTLSGSFHVDGCPVLSDDGLLVTPEAGRALALPTYPSLRLWPEALAGSLRRAAALAPSLTTRPSSASCSAKPRNPGTPLPLAALFVLAPAADNGAARISSLSGSRRASLHGDHSQRLSARGRRWLLRGGPARHCRAGRREASGLCARLPARLRRAARGASRHPAIGGTTGPEPTAPYPQDRPMDGPPTTVLPVTAT